MIWHVQPASVHLFITEVWPDRRRRGKGHATLLPDTSDLAPTVSRRRRLGALRRPVHLGYTQVDS